ncbi:MAG: hypothetical protein IKI38_04905 [Mogibacterium sp.]|nr:hypothetical protein [Mogibacterium sp.]
MTFFEYACSEVRKTYKRCGYSGLGQVARIPGGWVFCADRGPEYDDNHFYADDYLFAFEDSKKIQLLDWRSEQYKLLMSKAELIEVPKEYLSERLRNKIA